MLECGRLLNFPRHPAFVVQASASSRSSCHSDSSLSRCSSQWLEKSPTLWTGLKGRRGWEGAFMTDITGDKRRRHPRGNKDRLKLRNTLWDCTPSDDGWHPASGKRGRKYTGATQVVANWRRPFMVR